MIRLWAPEYFAFTETFSAKNLELVSRGIGKVVLQLVERAVVGPRWMDDYETCSTCRQSEVLMTWAMCLSCGDIKCGALVPCSSCQAPATGNVALDIAFSDHRIPRERLLELGAIVSEIHRICEDESLCLWTFLQYVSLHHPTILAIDLKEDAKDAVAHVLARLNVPPLPAPELSSPSTAGR